MKASRSPFASPAIRGLDIRLAANSQLSSTEPLRCSADVIPVVRELIGERDREHFVALYLNARHLLTHVHTVSIGTATQTLVHPREVFKGAILANAAALIVAHNHPSGDPQPSAEDDVTARRLREAGELLGIELLDAVIVSRSDRYYSMLDGLQTLAWRPA
ncbi:MAG: JAB domain-containing protein [bacterium]|nr:JAB domain-containing protein [bacterium]